ncbi:hypothetical protein [Shivajiella indica]|uniref:Uncharacterized protein n=1 Tax=Shivajiella indica TaxID=872115 RepID=A0ABW5B5F6_9BACT
MPETVISLRWDSMIDIIQSVQSEIVFISPSIHDEWALAFLNIKDHKKIKIWICLDNQEKIFREGYGDVKGVNQLLSAGVSLKQCKGLKICYLGIDGVGYCLFLESRIISGGPEGFNAILLPRNLSQEIVKTFFPEKFDELIFKPPLSSLESFDQEKFKEIATNLETKPIVLPDMQRQISVYNNHFQFVELSLEGGNITEKSVTIPSSALPFKDEALKAKMKTRYNLFEREETNSWNEMNQIKQKLEEIREKYLKPCSVRKGKRILSINHKEAYQKELGELESLIAENSKKLEKRVQDSIDKAEIFLRQELEEFLISFPPDSLQNVKDPATRKHRIDAEVFRILDKTKFPSAFWLIRSLCLKNHFYDLTWEDLQDEELLDWFKVNDLISNDFISELASVRNAYEEYR